MFINLFILSLILCFSVFINAEIHITPTYDYKVEYVGNEMLPSNQENGFHFAKTVALMIELGKAIGYVYDRDEACTCLAQRLYKITYRTTNVSRNANLRSCGFYDLDFHVGKNSRGTNYQLYLQPPTTTDNAAAAAGPSIQDPGPSRQDPGPST